jgi:heptosyltransferase-2
VGGPDEVELCGQVASLMKHGEAALNLAGKTSVKEVTAFFERCDLFIGNDAGLMHLATVACTPVIGIFGPTNSRAWGPYGSQENETSPEQNGSIVVQAELNLPCRPCLYRGFELGSRTGCAPRPCLTEIRPEQVLGEAAKLLENWQERRMKLNSIERVYQQSTG